MHNIRPADCLLQNALIRLCQMHAVFPQNFVQQKAEIQLRNGDKAGLGAIGIGGNDRELVPLLPQMRNQIQSRQGRAVIRFSENIANHRDFHACILIFRQFFMLRFMHCIVP